jgi:hypothetical protein
MKNNLYKNYTIKNNVNTANLFIHLKGDFAFHEYGFYKYDFKK